MDMVQAYEQGHTTFCKRGEPVVCYHSNGQEYFSKAIFRLCHMFGTLVVRCVDKPHMFLLKLVNRG